MAHEHIERLNKRVAELREQQGDLIELVIKSLRKAGASDDEIAREIRRRFVDPTPNTVEGGIQKSLRSAIKPGIRRGGSGHFQPALKAADAATIDPLNPRTRVNPADALAKAAKERHAANLAEVVAKRDKRFGK